MIPLLISAAASIVLYALMYLTSAGALQLSALVELAADADDDSTASRWSRLTQSSRDVVLAAEMFVSFAFGAVIVLAMWSIPRWCAEVGWPWFPCLAIVLPTIWILRIVIGDVLPRRVALAAAGPRLLSLRLITLSVIWWLLRPILGLSRWIAAHRPIPARAAEREEIVERAFDSLADTTGADSPVIEADEREMIRGVIGLEETEVREVMVPRVDIIAVPVDATVEDVRHRVIESGHSRLPVYDGTLDTIVGILYVKDLFGAEPKGVESLSSLVRRAYVVPESKKVDVLLDELRRLKTHIAIVVDEFGGTAGLVTLEDILEEIVGEIEDEHEGRRRSIEREGADVIHVDGVVSLPDIADEFGIELPDDEFETVSGLIYDHVGGVPHLGQTVHEYGLRFTIERIDGQRIRRVRIERSPETGKFSEKADHGSSS
jgi:CBS domain containing-hemolysin-like protein